MHRTGVHSVAPRTSFETKVLVAFSAAALVVLALVAMTMKLANDAADAARWVTHTHEVIGLLGRVRGDTLQIEMSTQNYRLSGEMAFVDERNLMLASREAALAELRQLTADNDQQRQRWLQLRALLDQRMALSRQIEILRRTEGAAASTAFAASAPLKETRARTHQLLQHMQDEEARLLALRDAEQEHSRSQVLGAGIIAAVLLLALLLASFVLIRRQLRATAASRAALVESEESLATTLRSIGDAVLETDLLGRITRLNPVAEALTGWTQAAARGRPIGEVFHIVHELTREPLQAPVEQVLASGVVQGLEEHTLLLARDGREWPIADSAAPVRDPSGGVIGVVLVFRDETVQRQAQRTVRQQNELLERHVQERTHQLQQVSRALRTLSAGNHAMLRATDEQGLLDSMCEAIGRAGGYNMAVVWYAFDDERKSLLPMAQHGYPEGLEGLARIRTVWADNEHGRGAAGRAVRTGQPVVMRDVQNNPDYAAWRHLIPGATSILACPLRIDTRVIGTMVIYDDAADTFDADEVRLLAESADDLAFGIATLRARAEQQRIQQAMYRLTRYDALTGLPNETQFSEVVATTIDAGLLSGRPFAMLQTNIERLSEINDALGFSQGDQMLREFGQRLQAAAPRAAMTARLRGDEFAVLLHNADRAAALTMLHQIDAAMAQPFAIAGIPLHVSARCGVALFPEHGATPHDLFRHMDIALQQAKQRGERHAFFDPAQNQQHHPSRLNMAAELRRAIEHHELRLFLQPKVEMATGRICGAEALVRWQHPTQGMMAPGQFIELAEHTGLIKPLTEWVIASALRVNRGWADQGRALPIAVNLSARNLRDRELLDKVRQMREAMGSGAGQLEFEITETTVMEDAAYSLSVLHGLRDQGIPLYIDDFGTGYSSLAYLQKLPVETIKIDQSFVFAMASSKDAAAIVRSTIDLVHDLGRRVVAEGVESQEHWDRLAELGCDIAQGYFIARPMPAENFQDWLASYRPPLRPVAQGELRLIGGGGDGGLAVTPPRVRAP